MPVRFLAALAVPVLLAQTVALAQRSPSMLLEASLTSVPLMCRLTVALVLPGLLAELAAHLPKQTVKAASVGAAESAALAELQVPSLSV